MFMRNKIKTYLHECILQEGIILEIKENESDANHVMKNKEFLLFSFSYLN